MRTQHMGMTGNLCQNVGIGSVSVKHKARSTSPEVNSSSNCCIMYRWRMGSMLYGARDHGRKEDDNRSLTFTKTELKEKMHPNGGVSLLWILFKASNTP